MLKPSVLGLADPVLDAVSIAPELDVPAVKGLESGGAPAQGLARVWAGQPGTILSSPPGGGKSTSVAAMAATLVMEAGLQVVIATPTRAQAAGIMNRLDGPVPRTVMQMLVRDGFREAGDWVTEAKIADEGSAWVKVTTVSHAIRDELECDVLIIDEAYQTTYADVSVASRGAKQLLLVGDPGQIGPVITADVSAFTKWNRSPHAPAPTVFERRPDFVTYPISQTYRLGPETVALIAGMYPFPFVSRRAPQRVERLDGMPLPEVSHIPIGEAAGVNDPKLLMAAIDHAASLVGCTHAVKGEDGIIVRKTLNAEDVAVVAAYNTQVSFIRSRLDEAGLKEIEVGTADRLQGGQWAAVVAVDPTAGSANLAGHNVSTGRMCVMLSRHTAHLCWVGEATATWRARISSGDLPARDRGVAIQMRMNLDKTPCL